MIIQEVPVAVYIVMVLSGLLILSCIFKGRNKDR